MSVLKWKKKPNQSYCGDGMFRPSNLGKGMDPLGIFHKDGTSLQVG